MRAQVKNGRLVLDEPTTLPEGTEVELVVDEDDGGDDLTEEERAELYAELDEAERESRRGLARPFGEFMAEFRARR